MANKNCGCAMSVLQNPCPREPFKCNRCLSAQKNTGRVWQITCNGFTIKVFLGNNEQTGDPEFNTAALFVPFTKSLYWDYLGAGASSFVASLLGIDVTPSDVECVNGVFGADIGTILNPNIIWYESAQPIAINKPKIEIFLYWNNKNAGWGLSLLTNFTTITDNLPAKNQEVIATGVANYESGESGCFYDQPATFNLIEWYAHQVIQGGEFPSGVDVGDRIVESGDIPFPQQISFQHINIINSDL